MPRPKKGEKTPGSGRQKGTTNQKTAELKEMVFEALNRGPDGGAEWLYRQREDNPVAFLAFLGKFVPKDVNIGGQKDSPVVTMVQLVPMLRKDIEQN